MKGRFKVVILLARKEWLPGMMFFVNAAAECLELRKIVSISALTLLERKAFSRKLIGANDFGMCMYFCRV